LYLGEGIPRLQLAGPLSCRGWDRAVLGGRQIEAIVRERHSSGLHPSSGQTSHTAMAWASPGQTVLPVAAVGAADKHVVEFVRQVSASLDCLGNADVDQAVEEPVVRARRI
jgi:hypothetical protein